MKTLVFLFVIIFSIVLVGAQLQVGSEDTEVGINLIPSVPSNVSESNVTSADYWGSYLYSNYNMPLILSFAINETLGVYNMWNAIWFNDMTNIAFFNETNLNDTIRQNITGDNIDFGNNNVTALYFFGNGSQLTDLPIKDDMTNVDFLNETNLNNTCRNNITGQNLDMGNKNIDTTGAISGASITSTDGDVHVARNYKLQFDRSAYIKEGSGGPEDLLLYSPSQIVFDTPNLQIYSPNDLQIEGGNLKIGPLGTNVGVWWSVLGAKIYASETNLVIDTVGTQLDILGNTNVTGNLTTTSTITTTNATGYDNLVVCYLAGGTLGHCVSVVGLDGSCTCNLN